MEASKEISLEINVEKTKYMLVSRDQNAGQIRKIRIGKRSEEWCHLGCYAVWLL
jgi:hypothetical protein